MKKTKSNGITLIALVVTIMVLLILAGVSIIVLFGDNGIIKVAGESGLQTRLSEIEERANIAYADLNSKKYAEGNLNKVITMIDIKEELEKIDSEKYQIRMENPEGTIIKGIKLDKANIKLGKGDTTTINVTFDIENNENTHYYAKVEEKYYEISIKNNHITLDKTNGKTEEQLEGSKIEEPKEITAISSNENVATIKEPITQNETGASIEITAGETIGEEAIITVSCEGLEPAKCKVIIKFAPTGNTANNIPIENGYGKIDIVWLDENNNIISQPNAPILGTTGNKMTPIKWNGTTLVDSGINEDNTAANGEETWYDYENHRWANARTNNESYFVWIPRYAYRITYYESKDKQETELGWYDGYGMWSKDGQLRYKLDDGIESIEAEDGNLYIVHPAFGSSNQKANETNEQYSSRKTQNINNGGWGETLTGFWFAKFEISQDENNLINSIPGSQSIVNKTIGEFYTMARTATYGQTGVKDSTATDGIIEPSFMNSHMVKNSEWGACAYLTYSKYGRNGDKIESNTNNNHYTGGGQSNTAYMSNENQSTTGNVYGIYDMRGGTMEFTALFNDVDLNNYFEEKSKWTENTKLKLDSNSTKYVTKYANDSRTSNGEIICTVGKIGDATKEVYIGRNFYDWFGDGISIVESGAPFNYRGGAYSIRIFRRCVYLSKFIWRWRYNYWT